jgi:hypothetical protein
MAPVAALKVAVVAFAATVTEAGMLRIELLSVSVTVAPLEGAALDNVTVQVVEAFGPMLVGLQLTEETVEVAEGVAEGVRLRIKFAQMPL